MGGRPRLAGNSFTGIDRPVQVGNPTDVSGIHDNTATGTPLQRLFHYSGAQVTGHWTPEGADSGVIHSINGGTVVDGGHADFGPGAIAKIGGWQVDSGGRLTVTGSATDRPMITAACDTRPAAGGNTGCAYADPDSQLAALIISGDAAVAIADADLHRIDATIGTSSVPATGSVQRSVVTSSRIKEAPASLSWSDDGFVSTTVETLGGRPRLVGSSFAGIDRPVQVGNPTDVSGIHDNTATGTPLERLSPTTARWSPATGSRRAPPPACCTTSTAAPSSTAATPTSGRG